MSTLWQDLFYGLRRLGRSPGFTLTAVLTLALGIGANTAIFQLVEAVQLRSVPVRDPGGLVEVRIADMEGARGSFGWHAGLTNAIWEELRRRQDAVAGAFAWGAGRLRLESSAEARFASAILASGGFFDTLGVRAAVGRVLGSPDDQKGCSAPTAVLSHAFWQREYGGDSSVVGRRISLGGYPYEVVGVAAAGFTGLEVGRGFDVAVPICAEALPPGKPSRLDNATAWWLVVMGRVSPGERARASASLAALSPGLFSATLPANYPQDSVASYRAFKLSVSPASGGISRLREQYSASLLFLQATAALVLLVGCANLASLMLARASAREKELAARVALGAGRLRLVRLLLSESLLLAFVGALLGAWLASWLSGVLVAAIDTRPSTLFLDLGLDWRVFGFAALAATLTCAFFGLAPALRAASVSPETVLRSSGRGTTEGRARLGLRRVLVVGQVALSLVLVAGAFVFARSLSNLLRQDTGMALGGVEIAYADMGPLELPASRLVSLRGELYSRLRAVPGVVSVAETTLVQLSGSAWGTAVWPDGGDRTRRTDTNFAATSPDYFKALGIELLAGRTFDSRVTLGAPRVAVVSQAFARAVFGSSEGALGRRFWQEATPNSPDQVLEVVGLVEDTVYRDLRRGRSEPNAYVALSQDPDPGAEAQLVIRTSGNPSALVPSLRAAIHSLDPAIVTTFQDYPGLVERQLVRDRVVAGLSSFFGVLALLLATLGLYGVMAFAVSRRTAEIGIRMALGAERAAILRLVLREALALVALGLALGLALSLALARTVRSLVFGLEPHDPLTIILACAVLGLVGLAASYFPARRAARLDPVTALRQE
jgi:predicted permease